MEVQRVQYQQLFEPVPADLGPEETLLSKYWRQPSEPKRFERRSHASLVNGFFASPPLDLGPEETIVSKWWQPASEPKRRRRQAFPQGMFTSPIPVDLGPEETTVDRWWRPASEPRRYRRRNHAALQGGRFASHPLDLGPEETTLDRWWQPASTPVRRRRRPEGQSVFPPNEYDAAPAEDVTLDKWFRLTEIPRRRTTRPRSGMFEALSTAGEDITLDKWWQPASEPKRRRRQAFPTGYIALAPDTTGEPMPDMWFALPQYRFRLKGRPRTGLTEPMSTDGEAITVDKWFRETQQPYLIRLRRPWLLPPYSSDLIDYGSPVAATASPIRFSVYGKSNSTLSVRGGSTRLTARGKSNSTISVRGEGGNA